LRPASARLPRARARLIATAVAAGALLPAPARSEEMRPRLIQEPGDVVDVIDAFDFEYGDPFDISISLGFQYLAKRARILRETSVFAPGLTTGGFTARTQNVGEYIETTSKLIPRLDIGLFHDIALYTRIPIILNNSRRIDPIDGTDTAGTAVLAGAPGETLFNLPFEGPDRSGVEHIAVGLDVGILNQGRDATKPTWIGGIELRISAGEPMHACNANPRPGQPECANPGDVNRNGVRDPTFVDADGQVLEAADASPRDAGVTRGTIGFEVHSIMSRRIKYIEPYGGFTALFEFQSGEATDYGGTDFEGALVNHPPIVGTVLLGMMIHPWEDREASGRLTIDLRFQGEYHSEGRDYSELFDALGSTEAASLRTPRWTGFRACPFADCRPGPNEEPITSVVDPGSDKAYFSGLSVVEAYGSYRGAGSVTWRAGEYVKLTAGMGVRFDQPHGITHDQPCNPDLDDDPSAAGPCKTESGSGGSRTITGQPNPAYRPTVNAIGRRFFVDESVTFEVFASGVVMF
jgi:hypothetical protein